VQAIYRDLVTIPLNFYTSEQLAGAALDLAISEKHSVYDLVYVALAIHLDCELVTSDGVMVSKLAKTHPLVRHLSQLSI
jgi:predicted nucleic acid-binding protein